MSNMEESKGYQRFIFSGHVYVRNKDKSILIDLTNVFGVGNEPTLEKMILLIEGK